MLFKSGQTLNDDDGDIKLSFETGDTNSDSDSDERPLNESCDMEFDSRSQTSADSKMQVEGGENSSAKKGFKTPMTKAEKQIKK